MTDGICQFFAGRLRPPRKAPQLIDDTHESTHERSSAPFWKAKIRLREFDVKPPISQQPITNAPSFPLSRLNALTQVLLLSRDQPAAQCPNSPAGYSRGLPPFQSYPVHPYRGCQFRAYSAQSRSRPQDYSGPV